MIRPPQPLRPDEPRLPFDPVTVLVAVLYRWRRMLLAGAGATALGVLVGLGAGTRMYTAETVLLHRPRPSVWIGPRERGIDSLSLRTKLNLVKVRSNLEEVRERLGVSATLTQLGSAIAVTDQRETDLLIVRSQWSDAATARDLATTMSDVFLKSQVLIRYREERSVVEQLRREAVDEAERLQAQLDDFGRITADLQERIALERAQSPEDEGLGQLSIRMSQLRDAIRDDQDRRANGALLEKAELQLSRIEALHATSAATDQELEEARAERDRLEAITVDTEQIAAWRAELERLQRVVLPSEDETTASAPLLQAVMFRALEAEFDLASARERVAQFEAVRSALDEQIGVLDGYRGSAEGDSIPRGLAEADFQVVTPARTPVRPSSSNRRLVAAAAWILLFSAGLVFVVGAELLTSRFRSGRELSLRADLPVLGVIPDEAGSADRAALQDARFRILAQSLLTELPTAGSRVLVSSAERGEGRTTATLRFASALGELGERVLVIDADGRRSSRDGVTLAGAMGVEAAASGSSSPVPSRLSGVDFLELQGGLDEPSFVPVGSETGPRKAGSYRLVLIDGPPVLPDADAQRLAETVDGVLMVTRSHQTRGRSVRAALARLEVGRDRIVLGVLNATRPPFVGLT